MPEAYSANIGQAPELILVEGGQYFVGQVDIGVDVLHVVALLQRVDELEHLAGTVETSTDTLTDG